MKNNLLRVKLLFAAAVLTVTALQTRPAIAACRIGSFITSTEQECLELCTSRGCNYSYDAELQVCTCNHG